MSDLRRRLRMKALMIFKYMSKVELLKREIEKKYSGPLVGALVYSQTRPGLEQIRMIAQTPARLFCHDKPEIDKRRWAKHQAENKAKAGGAEYIVKINQGVSMIKAKPIITVRTNGERIAYRSR